MKEAFYIHAKVFFLCSLLVNAQNVLKQCFEDDHSQKEGGARHSPDRRKPATVMMGVAGMGGAGDG